MTTLEMVTILVYTLLRQPRSRDHVIEMIDLLGKGSIDFIMSDPCDYATARELAEKLLSAK